jgi:peptidoglycan/LPS O-acetylase OafA/YrhL
MMSLRTRSLPIDFCGFGANVGPGVAESQGESGVHLFGVTSIFFIASVIFSHA